MAGRRDETLVPGSTSYLGPMVVRRLAGRSWRWVCWVPGLLLILALAVPFYGWAGLETEGVAVALLGAVVLPVARRVSRPLVGVAGLLGGVGGLLLVWRLGHQRRGASPAVTRILSIARSGGALDLALVAAVLLVLVSVIELTIARADRHGLKELRVRPGVSGLSREAWGSAVLWGGLSRILVWTAGVGAVLVAGVHADVAGVLLERPFGGFANQLIAPATSWDAGSYLAIAEHGYAGSGYFAAYYPLYPCLIRLFSWSEGSAVLAGIAIAVGSFGAGLYLVHRLVSLDFDAQTANRTVAVIALFPTSLFFSAVYTEALFLALSVGAVYAARRERWWWAGCLGAAAALTRPNGLTVLVPLVWIYLYGPRRIPADLLAAAAPWRPRFRIRPDAAALLLPLLAVLGFFVYLGLHGDWLGPLHAERLYWGRTLQPFAGLWRSPVAAVLAVRELLTGTGGGSVPAVGVIPGLDPQRLALVNLVDFTALAVALATLIRGRRLLPPAYTAYLAVSIALPLVTVPPHEPLQSFPRFLAVMFPSQLVLARTITSPRWGRVALLLSAAGLAVFSTEFARGLWVA